MEILSVEIDGFKNLTDTHICFDGVTVLLSTNNYGKSNLLKAIKTGMELPSWSGDNQAEFISFAADIPRNKINKYTDFRFQIVLNAEIDNEIVCIRYGYIIKWAKCVKEEWLEVRNPETGRWNDYLRRESERTKYKTSETGGVNSQISVNNNELAITSLRYRREWKYIAYADILCRLSFPVEERLESERNTNDIIRMPKFRKENLFNEVDTTVALYWLNKENPGEFNLIKNAFLSLFPQYNDVNIHPLFPKEELNTVQKDRDKLFALLFNDKYLDGFATISDLSNGTKRLLNTVIWAVLAGMDRIPLIGFEEVETSIHPSLIGRLFDIETQIAGNCKYIFTSHSPSVVQFLEITSMYVGEPRTDGLARFTNFTENGTRRIKKIAQDEKISTGEVIFNCLSGNDESMKLLTECLR